MVLSWASAVSREGPFDAYCAPMDTGDTGLPGCPYRIMSYTGPAAADTNPAFGIQLHHPWFLEFIGAPESARLLYRSPTFWVENMDTEDAVAAAGNLQRDAGLMLSNLQILSLFVTSLQRMSTVLGHVVFPSHEVAALSPAARVPWAAQYMSAMGLWRPQMGPGDPGPLPASSCNACMNCRYCFPEGPDPSGS